jgi:ubiquinone/menaquinone biosynthesis C-methylase UbiE
MPGNPIFAALYDRLLASAEKAGLAEMRADLLREASGRVLELGAGTGLNLGHYTGAVSELVLTEPDPHMAKRLRAKVAEAKPEFPVEILESGAESLPFGDDEFDTVVATLVFCTIPDPAVACSEAARVLAPEGRLLLMEHVRGEEGSRKTRWQDRLERPWGWVTGGCHPNRDTASTLGASFDVSGLHPDTVPKAPPIAEPMIRGVARPLGG